MADMEEAHSGPLLGKEDKEGDAKPRLGKNLHLFLLLVGVVASGTANRVTFKIMQFGTINYLYFVSQFTTLVYIPVNLAVVLFKIFVTKTITPEMRQFPQKSLFVMGLLDSLQGLLIVVGGAYVPGMMQNLLLQGAVPVTMLFSLLLLRPRGCKRCRAVVKIMKQHGKRLVWEERSTLPARDCSEECVCKVEWKGGVISTDQVLCIDPHAGGLDTVLSRPIREAAMVTVHTSGQAWGQHLTTYYTVPQYVGASVVLAGLVVSVWPSISGGGDTGPILWDMIFFLATIPTALSGVYKEIGFRKVELDVWYLNFWVAVYQTLCTLLYFPLAAKMSDIPLSDVPQSIARGFMCYAVGTNYVKSDCSVESDCGSGTTCCDSCDGSIHDVSGVSALWGLNMYMLANLAYNIALVSVIKHGSAALMYIASTIVLPLGAVCFSLGFIMGPHAQSFTAFTTAGLIVVLLGLVTYRFVPSRRGEVDELVPNVGATNALEYFPPRRSVSARPSAPLNRSTDQVRSVFYGRLGFRAGQEPVYQPYTPPPQANRGAVGRSQVPAPLPVGMQSPPSGRDAAAPRAAGEHDLGEALLGGKRSQQEEKEAEAMWRAGQF